MKMISSKELLKHTPLGTFHNFSTFGAVSNSTFLKILNESRIIKLDEGEVVYHAGERSEQFYVVVDGKIELYRGDEFESIIVGAFGPGEQFGFAGMIALHDRRNTAIAKSECVVIEIISDLFLRLHLEVPQDFGILMLNLSREMARALEKRVDMIFDLGHLLKTHQIK